jgi:shikimate dehydrogenase
LLGANIAYSLSPVIFSTLFALRGRQYRYRLFDIADKDFSRQVKGLLDDQDCLGLNVTIPYKSQILPFCDGRNSIVDRIGATNCLLRREDKWVATNTDSKGFMRSWLAHFPPVDSALLLGYGGAARAVTTALHEHFKAIRIYVWGNNSVKLESFCREKGLHSWRGERAVAVINATPLGSNPQSGDFPNNIYRAISNANLFYDLIYHPQVTKAMNFASAHGCRVLGGLEMLIEQASTSAELWTNTGFSSSERKAIWAAVLTEQRKRE